MAVGYERIPDIDSGGGGGSGRNYRKLIAGFFCLFIVAGVVFSFVMTYNHDIPPRNYEVRVYQTSQEHSDQLKLMTSADFQERGFDLVELIFRDDSSENPQVSFGDMSHAEVSFDPAVKYQSVIGFGGAFTEASAVNFFKLPVPQREKFLEAYFGESGIGYSVGRISIGSCDFSLGSYSFDDVEGDYELEHFDSEVLHDTHQIIPFILAAMKKAKKPIELLASPWSPPAWMKVPVIEKNKSVSRMTGSHTPNGLRSDQHVMTAWARYISLFISAYENHGVPIWAITPQNEPEFPAPWEACSYNASFESYFVEKFLGPVLRSEHPELKILAFDHNKDHLYSWAQTMIFPPLSNKRSEFVDGMAFHWYSGNDRMLDGTYGYEAVNATYHLAPDKILMATEGCSCPGVEIDSWLRAERLGHDLMYDLNNFAQGWIDWNLLVDSKGGPNHLNNMCDSPIIAKEDFSRFHLQPKYFYMGHFSKFVPPQSRRIQVMARGNYRFQKIHPVLHSGLDAGVYPCEASAKQMWSWVPVSSASETAGRGSAKNSSFSVGYLRLSTSGTAEAEPNSSPSALLSEKESMAAPLVEYCLSRGEGEREFLTIWECPPITAKNDDIRSEKALLFQLVPLQSGKAGATAGIQYVQLRYDLVLNEESSISYCATLVPSSAGLVHLKSCSSHDENQQWAFHTDTGEIRSHRPDSRDSCLTAGWPYLSATGYLTPSNQIAVVLMNEAPVDTYVTLRARSSTHGHRAMVVAIHSHSIETVVFNNQD